jgi:hypothetical protein
LATGKKTRKRFQNRVAFLRPTTKVLPKDPPIRISVNAAITKDRIGPIAVAITQILPGNIAKNENVAGSNNHDALEEGEPNDGSAIIVLVHIEFCAVATVLVLTISFVAADDDKQIL